MSSTGTLIDLDATGILYFIAGDVLAEETIKF